jgi:phosphoglycerate kinase
MTQNNLFVTLDDIPLSGKRVLVRVDFNVPVRNGKISDDSRIRACLPTISKVIQAGGKLILMSHMGRPKEGKFDPDTSLAVVADHLAGLTGEKVSFIPDWAAIDNVDNTHIILLENVRFQAGETKNDDQLARKMAAMCDVYVNDAFAAAHRTHASTYGVAKYAPIACAGPLMVKEMEVLTAAFKKPARPMIAIVGGSKVSTKLNILKSLLERVDQLIIGGGIANTFLKATGVDIGSSLCEDELLGNALEILAIAKKEGKQIPLPTDVVCGTTVSDYAEAVIKPIDKIGKDDMILDIGPDTAKMYAEALLQARTIIWNGPLGVFEIEQFSRGTGIVANAIADSTAFSVAGGGDTLAAIAKFGIAPKLSYITTAGGAFLEFLEGKTLPAIAILEERALAWRATEREY